MLNNNVSGTQIVSAVYLKKTDSIPSIPGPLFESSDLSIFKTSETSSEIEDILRLEWQLSGKLSIFSMKLFKLGSEGSKVDWKNSENI